MNQDVNGNMILFWKEVSKANGGKVENSKRMKDGKSRLTLEEVEVRRIYKNILRLPRNKLLSTCVAYMEFGETTTSKESRLGELRLR